MNLRDNREQMVIATKYTKYWLVMKKDPRVHSSFQGNHSKSLRVSVEDSLKKLQTNCIDIDYSTSIPEVMQSLNPLATAGKVLYLGVSDTPAWVVSKANHYARDHGLAQFMIYQGMWNAANCDLERDIISMCRDEGMAIAPWSALGSGQFKTVEQRKQPGGRATGPNSEKAIKISEVLEKIAKEKILSSLVLPWPTFFTELQMSSSSSAASTLPTSKGPSMLLVYPSQRRSWRK